MALHGFTAAINVGTTLFNAPKLLEIGTSKGQLTIPILSNLMVERLPFIFHTIDIIHEPLVSHYARYIMQGKYAIINEQQFGYFIQNSLYFLNENNTIYDIVIIDGDHNYFTVSNELNMLLTRQLITQESIR